MSQTQVILNVGVSGAGKSTWTTEYIKKTPNTVRINRDDIRKMLFGTLEDYYTRKDLNWREKVVTEVEELLFVHALGKKQNIIVDNTNLKTAYINKWIDFVSGWNSTILEGEKPIEVKFAIFSNRDVEELITRVERRDNLYLAKKDNYIHKQYDSFWKIQDHILNTYPNDVIFHEIKNGN